MHVQSTESIAKTRSIAKKSTLCAVRGIAKTTQRKNRFYRWKAVNLGVNALDSKKDEPLQSAELRRSPGQLIRMMHAFYVNQVDDNVIGRVNGVMHIIKEKPIAPLDDAMYLSLHLFRAEQYLCNQ